MYIEDLISMDWKLLSDRWLYMTLNRIKYNDITAAFQSNLNWKSHFMHPELANKQLWIIGAENVCL